MENYSIVYKSIDDPSKSEVTTLIQSLKKQGINITDQIPGILLVHGAEANIRTIVEGYPNWSYHAVQKLD